MLKKLLKKKLFGIPVALLGAAGIGYLLYKRGKRPVAVLPASPTSTVPAPIVLPGYEGIGAYVTSGMVDGLGYDVVTGADAFGQVATADYAYDDTFAVTQ